MEIVAGYIPLKRAGQNFKATCPFHHEKTASFVVSPHKQIFHCFGCGVGGTVIDFVMKQERMEFPEAFRMLANKLGIEIPEDSERNDETLSLKETIYRANELAAGYFHQNLLAENAQSQDVRRYLKERGVQFDSAKSLKLGFALDKWEGLISHLRGKDVTVSVMEKAGLIVPKENRDGFYDRFRNRIVFPIYDVRSRCIGFGARALKDSTAKYINSPETPVYVKGQHLYGLNFSKDAVRAKDFAIVVEGYMDFLIPFQAGVDNIVASSGTALTPEQIRLLRRYTQNVVMLFDADQAGESAMIRSLDILIEEGMNVKVAELSAGEDPDSYVRKFGVNEFNARISEALSLFDYKFKVLSSRFSAKTVEGKAKIVEEMLPTINRFPNAVLKFGYLKELAVILAIPQEALLVEMQKVSTPKQPERVALAAPEPQKAPLRAVEQNLLKLILEEKEFLLHAKGVITVDDFNDERIRLIITSAFEYSEDGKDFSVSALMHSFADEHMSRLVSEILAVEIPESVDRQKMYRDCVNRIKTDRVKLMRQNLSRQIQEAESSGDNNRLEELKHKFNLLLKG